MLRNITDKMGASLLYVGLSASPSGGEYLLLAKGNQQDLAFCEIHAMSPSPDGFAGKIYQHDGELYAYICEDITESIGDKRRAFVVVSAQGSRWEIRLEGNFHERRLSVMDSLRQPVAHVVPGDQLSGSQYSLCIDTKADYCCVILALVGIERFMSLQHGR